MYDFTNVLGDVQAVFSNAISAAFTLALKLIFFGAAVQLISLFLPRWLRPLVPLAALLLVVAYPAQLSRLGDVLLARAGISIPTGAATPSVLTGSFPAGSLGGLQVQVQSQFQTLVDGIVAQLGL